MPNNWHLVSTPVFSAQPLPDLPPLRQSKEYQPVVVHQRLSLWDSLIFTDEVNCKRTTRICQDFSQNITWIHRPVNKHVSPLPSSQPSSSTTPVNMENLPVNNNNGQSYGYTLYETTITSGGALNSNNNVKDRALVRTTIQTHRQFRLSLLWSLRESVCTHSTVIWTPPASPLTPSVSLFIFDRSLWTNTLSEFSMMTHRKWRYLTGR